MPITITTWNVQNLTKSNAVFEDKLEFLVATLQALGSDVVALQEILDMDALEDLAGGDAEENGFHWGLGASYEFKEDILVFADYVALYDDTGFDYRAQLDDVNADTWTVGLTFKF